MKRARKLSIISAYDYPRNDYRVFWDIRVSGNTKEGWMWGVRFYDADTSKLLDDHSAVDTATSEDGARKASQEYVASQMTKYRRAKSWHKISKDDAHLLLGLFDAVRQDRPYEVEALKLLWDCENAPDTPNAMAVKFKWLGACLEQHANMHKDGTWKRPFGLCDRIRGLLKSQGYGLEEATAADAAAPTMLATSAGGQSGHVRGLGPLGWLWDLVEWFVFKAVGFSQTMRNTRVDAISNGIDGGSGAGLWRLYDGTRPATCGAATTLLAELTFTDPSAGAPSAGVLTFSSITQDSSANATGTCTWGRAVDSSATCVMDHAVGTSGSDLNLNTTSITTGDTVAISSAVLTEGNA
jgi:hypothetical protein